MKQDQQSNGMHDGPSLTQEAAREALVKTAEVTEYPELRMSVRTLRTSPFTIVNERRVDIGLWHCNLKDHTFVVAVDAGPIRAQYYGMFHREDAGEGKAAITHVNRN